MTQVGGGDGAQPHDRGTPHRGGAQIHYGDELARPLGRGSPVLKDGLGWNGTP